MESFRIGGDSVLVEFELRTSEYKPMQIWQTEADIIREIEDVVGVSVGPGGTFVRVNVPTVRLWKPVHQVVLCYAQKIADAFTAECGLNVYIPGAEPSP